jgi:hypothetical protein
MRTPEIVGLCLTLAENAHACERGQITCSGNTQSEGFSGHGQMRLADPFPLEGGSMDDNQVNSDSQKKSRIGQQENYRPTEGVGLGSHGVVQLWEHAGNHAFFPKPVKTKKKMQDQTMCH